MGDLKSKCGLWLFPEGRAGHRVEWRARLQSAECPGFETQNEIGLVSWGIRELVILEPKVIRLKFRNLLLKLLIDQVGSLAVFTSLLPKMLRYLRKFVYLLWHVLFFFLAA